MKLRTYLSFLLSLLLYATSWAQAPVKVVVYPGTELLQVIHLLADTAEIAKSTYNEEVIQYFRAYRQHPAVLMARTLPRISCDFPVRLSWAFYNFPMLKVATMQPIHMDGYEKVGDLTQLQAYFQVCARFYEDSHFWNFYKAHMPAYDRWINSFERGLYQEGMLRTLDAFYRLPRDKPVVFTLGALNCGSYAMSDLRGINPNLPNQSTIMVAYSQVVQHTDSLGNSPSFYAPAQTAQITWHELGHAYLARVFHRYQPKIQALAYIMQQDPALKKKAALSGGWSNYLNENTTQAVTSLLLIRTGKVSREAELKTSPDEFYLLYVEMLGIIEQQYFGRSKYRNFEQFFPILLAKLEENHPRH